MQTFESKSKNSIVNRFLSKSSVNTPLYVIILLCITGYFTSTKAAVVAHSEEIIASETLSFCFNALHDNATETSNRGSSLTENSVHTAVTKKEKFYFWSEPFAEIDPVNYIFTWIESNLPKEAVNSISPKNTANTDVFPEKSAMTCTSQAFEYEITPGSIIPDAGCTVSNFLTIPITITEDFTIEDFNLGLVISHTYRSDLRGQITSPSGTSTLFLFENGGAETNFNILLDSDAPTNIAAAAGNHSTSAPYYSNVFSPFYATELDLFDNENAMGEWTLIVCDAYAGDIGILERASLQFQGCAPNTNDNPADYTIDALDGVTTNTCAGLFTDSGDSNTNYSDSESYTTTFCSDSEYHIVFTFDHFNTQAGSDILNIYDGTSTSDPLIGAYSGFGPANSPGVVTSSQNCMTFEFNSNGATNSLGWEATISCTGNPPPGAAAAGWAGYPSSQACASNTELGGVVFEDNDSDGQRDFREAAIKGVTVTLFDENGQVGLPTTTDANGQYSFSGLTAATTYRVEFTAPDVFEQGVMGPGSASSVQFVASGACDADFGINDLAHYCDATNPKFVIPCYANGDAQHASNINSTGVASFDYNDSGDSPASSYTNYITTGAVGSVWGTAFDGLENKLYLSTMLKRHCGLGPGGIGAIYSHEDGAANNSAAVFYDFGALAGSVASTATRFPGSGSAFGQEGPCGPCDNIDPTTFGQIGKAGFGDLEINPALDKIYVSNLNDRKIYVIDKDNPAPGSATPLPGIPWLDNSPCTNGVARPWALEFRRGILYVGVLCDASLSSCAPGSSCSDLTANVYSFDGSTWTNVLNFPLDYYRQAYSAGSDYFSKWIDDWNVMAPFVSNKTDANFPQPIIMDIEFDDDHSMILGIGDRSGYQLGYMAPPPPGPSGSTEERNMVSGDILRAAYNNDTGAFTLENNGQVGGLTTTNPNSASGPGGKSFYWGDFWTGIGANKFQGGIGALCILPNSGQVMTPLADAIDYYSNGIVWLNNTNGANVKRLEVYQGTPDGNSPNFAKSAGVGDMSILCSAPRVELGNIVWWDDNLNGLQDPNELGIPNVTLELWIDPNGSAQGNNALDGAALKVAETTTDAYGRFVFSYAGNSNGLNAEDWSFQSDNWVLPDTFYQIRIPDWANDPGIIATRNSLGYTDHLLAPAQNQGASGGERDNDSYDNPGNAAAAVQTGGHGENNHSFDIGFGGVGGCDAPEAIPSANAPCEGQSMELSVAVTGGLSPYTFNWSGPNSFSSTDQNPSVANVDSALYAGVYYLTVTDDLGCSDTTHVRVNINRLNTTTAVTDATCGSNNGAIDLTISGFNAFVIDWDNDGTGDNDDPEDLSGLGVGNYGVTVTDDDGCSDTEVVSVGSSGSATLTETHVDASCGNSNGSIDLTITGASTLITWSNGALTEDLSGLSAGTYSVTVNNVSGCAAVLSVTLTDTPVPSVSATFVDETCGASNAGIDLTVSGGVAPYTIDWDNDGTGDTDDSEDLSDLAAGTYNVTIYDANSCTASTSVTISNAAPPTLSNTVIDETCSNSNASIDLTVTGGTAPYLYNWSNGLILEDIVGLSEGTLTVTVTDFLGCTVTTSVNISNSDGPTIALTASDALNCNLDNGSIDLEITGGTGPYDIDWNNDGFGDNDDTEDLTNLAAGGYLVIVTDANGCQVTGGISISNINDAILTLNVTDPTTCLESGSIDLEVAGGTGPYTFDWDNDGWGDNDDTEDLTGLEGGLYSVIVTDADGCTVQANASIRVIRPPVLSGILTAPSCGGSDGSISLTIVDADGIGPYQFDWDIDGTGDNDDTQDLVSIEAGNYTVTVTNAIGCTSIATFNLSTINAPVAVAIQTNPLCNGANGSIDLEVTGGTAPYLIDWDNDGTGDNDDSEDLISISAGSYGVTVTDNNGCQAVTSLTLISSLPPLLTISVVDATSLGLDGSIDLQINGIAPFLIDWDIDGTGDNDDTEDLIGLSAGIYNVIVTDANNCTAIASVEVFEPSFFSLGNRVFIDADNSGAFDNADTGLDGITLRLLNGDSSVFDSNDLLPGVQPLTVVSGNGGYYRFDGLPEGQYIIEIDSSNFGTSGLLENYISSNGALQEANPDNDVDENDNGLDISVLGAVRSGLITLETPEVTGETDEPLLYDLGSTTGIPALDNKNNLTVDFGFFPCNGPSADAPLAATGTCNGMTPNDDASVSIDNIADANRIGISTAGAVSYDGAAYAVATPISGNAHMFTGLSHNATYIIRLFNLDDVCYTDIAISIPDLNCIFYDWGDLPDVSASTGTGDYQTTLANNGPRHVITNALTLGLSIDNETDGQPSGLANGDGVDEDGLFFPVTMNIVPGGNLKLLLTTDNSSGSTAYLEIWIDWNNDGDFNEINEMVVDIDDGASAFPAMIPVTVPTDAVLDADLGVRARISNQDNMTPLGEIVSGEVEDFLIKVTCKDACLGVSAQPSADN